MSKKRREKRNTMIPMVCMLLFIGLFCVASYKVITQLTTEHRENQAFDQLIEQVQANRAAEENGSLTPAADAADSEATPGQEDGQDVAADEAKRSEKAEEAEQSAAAGEPEQSSKAEEAEPRMLPVYAPLYAQNPDFFGWIEIEGTKVNYPVMHTPRDPEHYLHLAFDGSYSSSGVPFLDGDCYMGCGNYIVYGHHMKNGTMFASIISFRDEKYWREHPVIRFDTLYERGTYEVIGAFYSKVYSASNASAFRYYNYTDLSDPTVFEEYMAGVKKAALYDTGIETAYGDQLLTLSTCEYSAENGRFVVVARKAA